MREAVEGRPFSCPKRLGAKADAAAGARSDSNCPSAVLLARLRTASRAIDCLPDLIVLRGDSFPRPGRRAMRRAGRLQTLLAALDAIVLPALGRASGAELAKPGKAPPQPQPPRHRRFACYRDLSLLETCARACLASQACHISRATGFRPLILRLLIQSPTEPRVPSGWRGARPDRL
jgi:hypothetical protein